MQDENDRLKVCLRQLRLPTIAANAHTHAGLASNEGWPHGRYLTELCELELAERRQRKIARLLTESKLPREKTSEMFDKGRLELSVAQKWEALKTGEFLERRENVLAFGNPDLVTLYATSLTT